MFGSRPEQVMGDVGNLKLPITRDVVGLNPALDSLPVYA
jgi:hypothetical protein